MTESEEEITQAFITTEFKTEWNKLKGESFNSREVIDTAVNHACIDMMPRTLRVKRESGVKIPEKGGQYFKTAMREELSPKIINYFEADFPNSEKEFDEWHYCICTKILKVIRQHYDARENKKPQYGKAQKILNMTFKYLYCFAEENDSTKCNTYFKYCHMPIDSIMLGWIEKRVKEDHFDDFEESKVQYWSNMDYKKPEGEIDPEKDGEFDSEGKYTYNKICKEARELSYAEGITPLMADFLYWEELKNKKANIKKR